MNRTTSLFLALGILLAHALAIHQTDTGGFAGAMDEAHVAFRVARQLFRDGTASWNSGAPSFDAYPSPLWILVSWLPERLYRDPSRYCQLIGLVCAFCTTIVVSRFSRDRLAGIIAPFLLVFSGAFASAATSGTEMATLALAMTLSFLSLERRRPRMLALSLCITAVTRPEGALFVLVLWLMGVIRELRTPQDDSRSLNLAIVPAAVALSSIALMRHSMTEEWLSPTMAALSEYDSERFSLGASYLGDFLLKSGSALLIVFPVLFLLAGKLRGMAARGLALVIFWFAITAWSGGTGAPFWLAIAPILPIMFVTIQETMTVSMDSERAGITPFTWAAFLVALSLSAMVSKKPGNLGSIAIADAHFAAMEASPKVSSAYLHTHGRDSGRISIRQSARLRDIGFFLSKEVNERFNLVTPWPGSIGYHSRREVFDLLGRTSLAPGKSRLMPWAGETKVDLSLQLKESPDHLLLSYMHFEKLPSARQMLGRWLETWDIVGDTPERRQKVIEDLSHYRLVTIPIRLHGGDSVLGRLAPFFLLRRRGTELDPVLVLEKLQSGEVQVSVQHRGYALLADLEVIAIDSNGDEWYLRPTGEFTRTKDILARPDLLLFQAGTRSLELIRARIPSELNAVEILAALRNPGTEKTFALSLVGSETRLELKEN